MTAATSVAERIAEVRAVIARACERAGRDPATVLLVGASKTQPPAAIREALEGGLTDFGENRADELTAQVEAARAAGIRPTWHFIGHLQRNKVREVVPLISALHSLDSTALIAEIERRREALEAAGAVLPLPCYLEVNVAGEAQKQGIAPSNVPALLAAVQASPVVTAVGLMTVAPLVPDTEQVRPVFRALRELAQAHGLEGLSMGMTDDYPVAIEEGATVVRVGRAIFGERRS